MLASLLVGINSFNIDINVIITLDMSKISYAYVKEECSER